ncbi:hypothetical protein H6G00_01285 [Leptolyngbya sp. FACHB-541]|uniref:hypothetical protein n=1 Tax=Leptolyngbya sp. FACHB-541 TaxID=2692810 RepID=UPI001686AB80|nr:hypothetical protein [Leptolyngbya sp. FACHB-541]MBD1995263.1 hypothetical protein [Leptolyngbya sp. FACHB-541]
MTDEELSKVAIGTVLRNKGSGQAYVVIQGAPVPVAVRAIAVTHANEWEVVEIGGDR